MASEIAHYVEAPLHCSNYVENSTSCRFVGLANGVSGANFCGGSFRYFRNQLCRVFERVLVGTC